MAVALFFLVLPVLLLAGLAVLPAGLPMRAGMAAGGLLAMAAPVLIGDDGTGFGRLLALMLCGAVGCGAAIQLARRRGAGQRADPVWAMAGLAAAAGTAAVVILAGRA